MEFSITTQIIILALQTLGPFTVLITVYFLVTELREQNKVARANARQNIADSHQRLALAGLQKELVDIKVKQFLLYNFVYTYSIKYMMIRLIHLEKLLYLLNVVCSTR